MSYTTHIENPDVVLIGSGIMSSNLGAMLRKLKPDLKIQIYEVSEELAQESSNAWNNAGTGHAGICELSYTPHQNADGSVDVSKVIEIFEHFEQSKLFWGYAIREGMIRNPRDCINPVPHISFVHGQKQVDFLRATIIKACPLIISFATWSSPPIARRSDAGHRCLSKGRAEMPIAATKMDSGTDVNFGCDFSQAHPLDVGTRRLRCCDEPSSGRSEANQSTDGD